MRKFAVQARALRGQIVNSPDWDSAPMIADRVTYEVAQFADPDAIIIHEAGSDAIHSFDFNPIGGRELFFYYGGHLGSGVGTAAGVKLARPNQQVICAGRRRLLHLRPDRAVEHGAPRTAGDRRRLQQPCLFGGPHSRVVANVPGGRMVQTGQFVHDYLGNPDMNMADIARGFGVAGEVVASPASCAEALARARAHTVDGKPYLLDVQVARHGVGWSEKPWMPPIQVASLRTKKV